MVHQPICDGLAAAERRQPVQDHREEQDQQDADQEGRQRHADQRHRLEQPARPVPRIEAGIDAHRYAEQQDEHGSAEGELQGRRHALQDHAADRLGRAVAKAELALHGIADEVQELDRRGIVEAELLAQRFALLHRGVLADHGVDRVADIAEQEEGDDAHRQQHGDGLQQASEDESEHRCRYWPGGRPSRIAAKTEPAPAAFAARAGRSSAAGRYFIVTKRSGKALSAGCTRSMFLRAAHTTACWCSGM